MIRMPQPCTVVAVCIPRESGDDPIAEEELEMNTEYSPRERG